jgi:hypothetical protein
VALSGKNIPKNYFYADFKPVEKVANNSSTKSY